MVILDIYRLSIAYLLCNTLYLLCTKTLCVLYISMNSRQRQIAIKFYFSITNILRMTCGMEILSQVYIFLNNISDLFIERIYGGW